MLVNRTFVRAAALAAALLACSCGGGNEAQAPDDLAAGSAAPTDSLPAPAPPDPLAEVRDQLSRVPVAYNKPTELPYRRTRTFSLVIDRGQPGTAGEALQGLPGEVTTVEVDVAREMTARLTGPPADVDISLRGANERRRVSRYGDTVWTWDVTAKTTGEIPLTAELIAHLQSPEGPEEFSVRTYSDSFVVQVSFIDRVKLWIAAIDPIWAWITGAVATVLGLLAAWAKLRGRKAEA